MKTAAGGQVLVRTAEIAAIGYERGLYAAVYRWRFLIAGALCLALVALLAVWFRKGELKDWGTSTWGFAKQIIPLLLPGCSSPGFSWAGPARRR